MAKLLTRRKAKWVAQRRNLDVVRGGVLNPNAATATRYQLRLEQIIRRMTLEVERELKALFETPHAEEYFDTAQDAASIASQARIITNALTKKYQDLFDSLSRPLAEQVANGADASSSASLHTSLKQLSGGLSLQTTTLKGPIMDVWKATVNENVALIKSIPQKYLNGVTQAVQRSITTGNGLQDLVPYLQKHKGITERRASFIAHDQTRKAFSSLNRARCRKLGVREGEWLHTSGSKEPRHTHIEMNGKRFDLSKGMWDPAVGRYIFPAEEPGCRCRMIPIIDLSAYDEQ